MLKLILFLILLFPQIALALTCISTATGNYNDSATWTSCGGGIPGSADAIQIGAHTVTVPNGVTAEMASGLLNNDAARLTIASGGRVEVNTNISIRTGKVQALDGGAQIHATNTTGLCGFVNIGQNWNGNAELIIGNDNTDARSTITTAGCQFYMDYHNGNGHPQALTMVNADLDASAGSTTTAAWMTDIELDGGFDDRLYWEGNTFISTDSMMIYTPAIMHTDAEFTIKDNYLEQIDTDDTANRTISVNLYNSKSGSGIRLIDGNTINGFVYIQENRGLTFTNNRLLWTGTNETFYLFTNSQDTAMVSFSGNIIRQYDGSNINIDTALYDNNYLIMDQSAKTNPHDIVTPQRNIGAFTVSNSVWESAATDNNGDSIQIGTASGGPNTITISGNIILPNTTDGTSASFGTLFTAGGNANTTMQIEGNTAYVGADQVSSNTTCMVVGETYASFTGALAYVRNNICFTDDATPTNTLYMIRDQTGTTSDIATSSNVSHNTSYNIGSDSAFSATCSNFNFSSGDCENSNQNSNPNFFDTSRNSLTFYEFCSGDVTPTYAELFAELQKRNDSRESYNTCYDDLMTYVRTGFSPSSSWAGATGSNVGSYIGAVEPGLGASGGAARMLLTGVSG